MFTRALVHCTCPTECTLCAQAHTPAQCPPHTIQSICTHHSTPVAETPITPTQACAMAARQPLCSSTMCICLSSPKSLHSHPCTRIASIESTPPTARSTPIRPAQCRSRPLPAIARLLYTRIPPRPRKLLSPQLSPSYYHPFTAAAPRTASAYGAQLATDPSCTRPYLKCSSITVAPAIGILPHAQP